jgi:lipopolysaccharide/colanic/teichoic acid biosynthesis glycosyltransferase
MSRIEEFRGPERDFQLVVKRVLDIIIAAVALILLAPLFLLVAIAIKLDSGGAIFASQVQYCYDNRLIHVLKFRCTAIGSTGKAGVTRIDRLLSGRDLGSRLIKSTIQGLRRDRQRPSSFEPACRSALRYV